ncbi:MAG: hypothetical protein HKN03_19310, partial [Acidimicrobiales bacterium]|nr:hypothetical protein [Acidimicrobiales bacterium]
MRTKMKRTLAITWVAALVGLTVAAPASAGEASVVERPDGVHSLVGLNFTLQNYFDTDVNDPNPDTLIPFFEP